MNKLNEIKKIKFCIGPMSKNIVDTIINFSNKNNKNIMLIPSRRQIEYNGGYVNNWNTKDFCSYVKSKSNYIYLQRDHSGPGQGTIMDDGLKSLEEDCKYFDIIHIDPWKKYTLYKDGLESTIKLINYCYNLNNNLYFEISTEEAIRKFEIDELKSLMNDLKKNFKKEVYDKIIYLVIQSGTSLKEGVNTGIYNNLRLTNMIKLTKELNVMSKEHNGDWIRKSDIVDKFNHGLNALNIAPEFGMIETKVILEEIEKLDEIKSKQYFEKFFEICYNSKKWVKWVKEDFDPFQNKKKLIEICGHYVFTNLELINIKNNLPNIDDKIKQSIYKKLENLFNLIN